MPPNHWNKGYGRVLANSYLYYGPKLGYQGSVFNLVYVNNIASIKCVDFVVITSSILLTFSVAMMLLVRLGCGKLWGSRGQDLFQKLDASRRREEERNT